MIFTQPPVSDAWIIDIERRGDDRGFFARTMCKDEFAEHGMITDYVQQNSAFSAQRGTLRGMHFQTGSAAEAKLVRCLRGAIFDVIVDLRHRSPTYLKHAALELNAEDRRQIYVPPGFAHGYQTLMDDTEISYLVSAPYSPAAEEGLKFDDRTLGIVWPLPVTGISAKDLSWPALTAEGPPFF
ncbi:dTDP-4-dehydrorhamnose 3,5-epimerase [Bradyrhizobium sp. USDA 336]|uniref:dTDP-4-dehydrorhamnose 3,5-epimerase n=1 Tax=Bradyrhizobium sp. USDA 336 TaxID=3156311 RepID=UPI003835386C